ncbi:FAD-dependent oxidoreductase [Nakamurella sp. YIM 132087]|uniref:FAD-dependent oxidoreductase n=1 Tax=Nakamurella alba TaxID=2665158 RepID=A0A7K1FQK5_9ACTN|nr:NAD(P)/FAD-dependent oxidoreductase [Nakamurella alba]MTD15533.1 FAD-dependent oxidoreductase [Nakamurella alba]
MQADLVVVGAGPAGLAAAVAAAGQGLSVALVDAGHRPGGQFYRHRAPGIDLDADLHHDLDTFRRLTRELDRHRASRRISYLPQHHVWTVTAPRSDGDRFAVHAVDRSAADPVGVEIPAAGVVLATGSHDRTVPFPGWDLPGVVTAGAAQSLLKGQGVRIADRVLVAGTGPFLLPVAVGLLHRGVTVVGVHDAGSAVGWRRHLPAALPQVGKLAEGAEYLAALVRHRVPFVQRSMVVRAHGDERVTAVTTVRLDSAGGIRPGTERRIETDAVAVGMGFSPATELALSLGCATATDPDGSAVVAVDADQRTDLPGVWVAGEATGVGGAPLAVVEGTLAGLAAARAAGRDAPAPRRLVRRRERLRRFARALQEVYPEPVGWMDALTDDTVICRCEEVTAGDLAEAIDLGAADQRTAKLLCRAGMGWCQGRICGRATAALVTRATGSTADAAMLARRPLAATVPLGVLAAGAQQAPQK